MGSYLSAGVHTHAPMRLLIGSPAQPERFARCSRVGADERVELRRKPDDASTRGEPVRVRASVALRARTQEPGHTSSAWAWVSTHPRPGPPRDGSRAGQI